MIGPTTVRSIILAAGIPLIFFLPFALLCSTLSSQPCLAFPCAFPNHISS
jgi:hypothetical protein